MCRSAVIERIKMSIDIISVFFIVVECGSAVYGVYFDDKYLLIVGVPFSAFIMIASALPTIFGIIWFIYRYSSWKVNKFKSYYLRFSLIFIASIILISFVLLIVAVPNFKE